MGRILRSKAKLIGAELARHRRVVVQNTVDINVSGVDDDATIDAVKRTVHSALSHLVGTWHVKISPSAESRRWDLHLQGAFGHHVAHFLSEPTMPDAVGRRLSGFLHAVVPPLSRHICRVPVSYPVSRMKRDYAGVGQNQSSHLLRFAPAAARQHRTSTSRPTSVPPSAVEAFAATGTLGRRGAAPSLGPRLEYGGLRSHD